MKATVNRQLFIEQISSILPDKGISILVSDGIDGILTIASFGHGVTARIPVYAIKGGQAYLSSDEWTRFISMIETSKGSYIDIDL